MTRNAKRLSLAVWALAAAAWLTPLTAMQVTAEVDWTVSDFVVWGAMLAGAAGAFTFLAGRSDSLAYHCAAALALGAAFLVVWINLAVGIVGNEDNPTNLIFFGVLAIGAVGAFVARLRPDGMARALLATAVAQTLAGAAALGLEWGRPEANWPEVIVVTTAVFTGLWLVSAWLFASAAGPGDRLAAPT